MASRYSACSSGDRSLKRGRLPLGDEAASVDSFCCLLVIMSVISVYPWLHIAYCSMCDDVRTIYECNSRLTAVKVLSEFVEFIGFRRGLRPLRCFVLRRVAD